MKNPLLKRLPRELIHDFGKYLAVFLFMTATIGFVSGFLVADDSMLAAYQESFEKYHIEDGNFTLEKQATDNQIARLEKEGVQIYENYYVEEDADTDLDGEKDSTIRIYKNRSQVDLVCLMKGELPQKKDEIAIDRMYAENNKIQIGDIIKAGKEERKVTGYVALSDYSALFSDNADMMFDSVKFGVAIVTDEAFEKLDETHLKYRYSWIYDNPPEGETAEKERSDDFLEILADYTSVTGYIPRYTNQAINFTGDDMGSDRSMVIVLLYILIAIMAFVFAVTTSNTIVKEACVIGTLRASGYTRKELLVHYMTLPLLVTAIAAVIGNILGYTVFKNVCAGMYYGSYSLPTYETRWNMDAFILTTIVPFVIMLFVNLLLISKKLRLSPLKFIRRDLSASKKQK
ncbi:MAG: ABC transporter permease, partial [Lachnospiraceae bacterium]|nr:ABC transporter permease [Lachnospiraceae bacterium]